MKKVKLWARAGIAFDVPEELAEMILLDEDGDVIAKILTDPDYSRYWKFEGETYFPVGVSENRDAGVSRDLEFYI